MKSTSPVPVRSALSNMARSRASPYARLMRAICQIRDGRTDEDEDADEDAALMRAICAVNMPSVRCARVPACMQIT